MTTAVSSHTHPSKGGTLKTAAWAATSPSAPLAPFSIERRAPGPKDVRIEILFCGVCHSDIHQARDEWGNSSFPMVPGHEIVGRVVEVGGRGHEGSRSGDLAGVGCMVDSCRGCAHLPQAASSSSARRARRSPTTAPRWTARRRPTAATRPQVVVTEPFVLKIPAGLDPAGAAPLLVRRHHHLLAAAPVERQEGRPRRRRGPRRPRATWR